MKRLFTLCAIVVAVVVSSCSKFDDTDIWDKLNDHESRITALEELCKQINTNITALQTIVEALEKNDYITNVSPVRKDGEVIGYTITFAHSNTITIYHGENGRDGVDGKDGYTPQIGVMKDIDGIYYWTLDGEWLLDGKGNKIQANGVDGIEGINGITPRLKIENDYWHVSYDEGATWIELGKATGNDGADGSDGVNGADGDSIFKSVTQDDEYVYFNLADGTMITLPKHDKEHIQFEDIRVWSICCLNWDTNNDHQLSYAEAAAITNIEDIFKANKEIIAFDELKYFTGLTSIPDFAFDGCTSLCKVSLPHSITTIGNKAFNNCSSIYTIEIPENVRHIGEYAFYDCCNLKNIKLPSSLLSIDKYAFIGSYSQKNIYISDLSSWCNIDFVQYSNPLNGGNLYLNGEIVTDLVVPNDVTTISKDAFSGCVSIISLTISGNVKTIDRAAFQGCQNLLNVSILEGVTTIGYEAFDSCTRLTTITLPSSVEKLGWRAFCFCDVLKYVYCKAIIPPTAILYENWPYGWEAFADTAGLKIYVPLDYSPEYKSADGWKSYQSYIYEYDFENNVAM